MEIDNRGGNYFEVTKSPILNNRLVGVAKNDTPEYKHGHANSISATVSLWH